MEIKCCLISPTFHEIKDVTLLMIYMQIVENTALFLVGLGDHFEESLFEYVFLARFRMKLGKHVDARI